MLMLVKKIAHRVISLYKRQDHIKYARSLGVKVGEASRFVDKWMSHWCKCSGVQKLRRKK